MKLVPGERCGVLCSSIAGDGRDELAILASRTAEDGRRGGLQL